MRRPPRRRTGVVLLLTVVLAVAAVAGTRPRSTTGQGTAAPATALPEPGRCLQWDVDPAEPLTPAGGTVQLVDCRRMHQGQVVLAWRSGTLDRAAESARCPQDPIVWEAGHPASGARAADWSLPVITRADTVISAGPSALDFTACVSVLRWESGRYSLLNIDRPLQAPQGGRGTGIPADATLSWCLDVERRSTSCQQPHTFERVGVFSTEGARSTPVSSCQERARAVVGSVGLVAGLATSAVLTTAVGSTTEETLGGSADVTFLLCDVVAPAGRLLTDTVVGWGARPLPLG